MLNMSFSHIMSTRISVAVWCLRVYLLAHCVGNPGLHRSRQLGVQWWEADPKVLANMSSPQAFPLPRQRPFTLSCMNSITPRIFRNALLRLSSKSSSTFRDRMIQRNWLRGCLLAGIASICLVNAAWALDSARAVSQYVHDKWGANRGFLGGTVYAICQAEDGFLWIGTERGLVSCDGFTFTLIQRPLPYSPPIGAVRGLVCDTEGNLWIRIDGPHLRRYREGRFEDAVVLYGLDEGAFTAMSLDSEGHLLLWGIKSRTLRHRDGKFQRIRTSEEMSGIAISVAETRDHRVWLGTRDLGLFRIDQGNLFNVSNRLADTSINALLPANNGGLWIGTDAGIEFLDGNGLVDKRRPS